MLRHVVLMRWKEGTTPAQAQAVADGLRALPAVIPEIRAYAVGLDVGGAAGHWDFAVVADFDDLAGFGAYMANAEHQRVIAEAILPIRGDRAFLQFEVD